MKKFKGTIIKIIDSQTLKAEINRIVKHPIYHKQYIVSKKYLIDCLTIDKKIGDDIEFIGCKPISKKKRFKIIEITKIKK
ncbi:MAG: 30S ribosomal protein S17 [Candidatus Berkelbacteria bacterium Licking1014_85]|uniref:30S ribosomal protein S17 n=1 Tax=Candidatus Berkelbacteria bacterium Licking1014_85 TaxID=2017148 RepID=A0A554LMA3_9BACT|nr:MAG: 30S ribosomal protein S17 [Candidatus Berkelbacteria bacterium Licking1014_85]